MKKGLWKAGLLAMAFLLFAPALSAGQIIMRPPPPPPALGRNQGWLAITNHDARPWSIEIAKKGEMYVNEAGYGRNVIPPGATVTMVVEKDNWRVSGADGRVRVRVREGRASSLELRPIGRPGGAGLQAISRDDEGKVRDEVLFEDRGTVIVQRPVPGPAIVVPPPTVVARPPVAGHPRPPPPPQRHPSRRDGWEEPHGY